MHADFQKRVRVPASAGHDAAASKKAYGKRSKLSGTVMQTKDHAVSVLPGVKIETVEVAKGQKMQEAICFLR